MGWDGMKRMRRGKPSANGGRAVAVIAAAVLLATAWACGAELSVVTPEEAEAQGVIEIVDRYMGDWEGTFRQNTGKSIPLAAQVVALGKGRYHASFLTEFDKATTPIVSLEGQLSEGKIRFAGWGDLSCYIGPDWEGVMEEGAFTGRVTSRNGGTFALRKVVRLSPTLGAPPPARAVVLFDGTNFDQWEIRRRIGSASVNKTIAKGAMRISPGGTIATKKTFGHLRLHLEFRTPFLPEAREQGRGNSGVFVQGLEIQVLDSYGLRPYEKGGGGIYSRVTPLVNMCAPPMQWQTYDVTVQTPKDGGNGRLTVLQNGVQVHDAIDIGRPVRPDGIRLQDHGNPVEYRNIWLVELP